MVFSKSALSPPAPAAAAASPMNLSLYLPSSMTSLFCRKCFLIGLPLTTRAVGAAEVLEERVVQDGDDHGVLAAHREVVDLDVVVRLAADGGALLGQGDLLEHQPIHAEYQFRHSRSPGGYFSHAEHLGHDASAAGVLPQDADEYNRNVVAAAVVVGHLHQLLRGELEVGAERLQRHADVLVLDHVAQAVGAEQVDVARLGRVLVDLGLDGRVDAERLGDQVLVLRVLRLLGGDQAGVDLLLQQRMVARHLLEAAAAQQVQARVAEVRDQHRGCRRTGRPPAWCPCPRTAAGSAPPGRSRCSPSAPARAPARAAIPGWCAGRSS